jgi:hypothetical protein
MRIRPTSAAKICKKKFREIEGLTPAFLQALGNITYDFRMIVWGQSGNGKSNFVMRLAAELMRFGSVLYLSLEEGKGPTLQTLILRYIPEELRSKLLVVDTKMTYHALMEYLARPRTPAFVIVDSLQYFNIDYRMYQALQERFQNKAFVFVSHAKGKMPDGKTADKIRYDAGVKIRVEHDIAFVMHSRYGGSKNLVIWEEGAKKKRSAAQFKKDLNR